MRYVTFILFLGLALQGAGQNNDKIITKSGDTIRCQIVLISTGTKHINSALDDAISYDIYNGKKDSYLVTYLLTIIFRTYDLEVGNVDETIAHESVDYSHTRVIVEVKFVKNSLEIIDVKTDADYMLH